ncbi:hypothetical protein B0A48_05693 [Cryoendolithus antarcticus]|uniref:Uncharacterized protein n=1 Tax=Cryoendolithus antarcticus TaxID=1507870 RepID=A0A1V8TBM8_9PEZI|nr:hypothetical protein B0A48_05693 [Cryoendolithus antarcticus]
MTIPKSTAAIGPAVARIKSSEGAPSIVALAHAAFAIWPTRPPTETGECVWTLVLLLVWPALAIGDLVGRTSAAVVAATASEAVLKAIEMTTEAAGEAAAPTCLAVNAYLLYLAIDA